MEDNKKTTLSTTLKQIEKQFGKGSVMRLGDMGAVMNVETVSTGSLSLDLALGIGGLPRGRVVEIYGPEASGKTTLTLHVASEIQRQGGVAAFIDAEHALDSKYAEKLGVNIGELLLAQPSSGEEALEIADIFVRSGSVDLVVIDSVAALTPKAELEGDMGDSHMGLHARLMSQALRKLTANIKRSNTLVIFINQIRMKIGVTWGCFHYDTPVVLSDGKTEKIGNLVTHKMPAKVLSYNADSGKFEARRITNWYNNGNTQAFWQFRVGDRTTSHHFVCTSNHRLLTPKGYRAAGNLNVGDKLMTCQSFQISPLLEQVTWGTLLGNHDLRSLPHKIEALAGRVPMKVTEPVKIKATVTKRAPVLEGCQALAEGECGEAEEELSEETLELQTLYPSPLLVERLEPLAIALWYIDQGTLQQNRCVLSCSPFAINKQQILQQWFQKRGLSPSLTTSSQLTFNERDTVKLHEMIANYVPSSVHHKLLPAMRGRFAPVEVKKQRVLRAVPMPILEIRQRQMTVPAPRFDLEIEGNHNYLVDNVIVHNSPETTTGGNALKFYASVRLDIRRIGPLKRGEEIIGNETRVKIVKNKLAPPLREVTFDMIYGEGISRIGEIIDLGVKYEVIDKAGTWYSYNGERLGQGKETVRNFLKEHPNVATQVEKQIRDKAIVKPIVTEFVDNGSDDGADAE